MINIKETAMVIVEELSTKDFNDVTCGSGYFIVKEFEDGTDRAVDVYKSTLGGYPHYVIYCSYEDDDFDYMYTDDLSVGQLESKLEEFCMA